MKIFEPYRGQANRFPVKPGRAVDVRPALELARQVVGPGVIRAHQERYIAAVGDQRVGAMLAHVVESADGIVLTLDAKEVLPRHAEGKEVAGLLEL